MNPTFKTFLKCYDLETPDEQLDEIFGMFSKNKKIEALRKQQADRRAKTSTGTRGTDQAERDKDAAWAAAKNKAEGGQDDEVDPKTGKPVLKPSGKTSAQAQDRNAEREWVTQIMNRS
jgi:hypothetical protein